MSALVEPPDWVAAPELREAWERIGESLERRGLVANGRVVVQVSSREERHALGDLLGRPVSGERCTLDLADLDARMRNRAGIPGGAVEAAAAVLGRELVDKPARRGEKRKQRARPFEVADQWLMMHHHLQLQPWLDDWLAGVRRDGLLTRRGDQGQALLDAMMVLQRLVLDGRREQARTELAAQVLHSSHALDDGTLVAALVLRGLAAASSVGVPTSARDRQALWESFGVVTDSVSSTCLTLGLRWEGQSAEALSWNGFADRGAPLHLTRWDLRAGGARLGGAGRVGGGEGVAGGGPVLVCENPRVLEALAERFGGSVAVVCTSGRPNLVTQDVLVLCADAGRELRYHGDFDWPGIAIANQVIELCDAEPWLMTSQDYLAAPGSLPLSGSEVEPSWDDELGAAMRGRGVVVHEEAVLDQILKALEDW